MIPVTVKQRKIHTSSVKTSIQEQKRHLNNYKTKTPFRDNGTVTAGNASGVNDGAAALIIASDTIASSKANTTGSYHRYSHLRR
ncbi:hypothetical protein J4731_10985 [Providencia rettgeri]|nr:hypothetical protein [Providencia rettgeri]